MRMRNDSTTTNPDHANLAPPQGMSTLVVDQFPSGSLGRLIPNKPQGSSVHYESRRAASMDSPWAPFRSELDWNVARWAKMRGRTSAEVAGLLAIPGVCGSHRLYTIYYVSNPSAKGRRPPRALVPHSQGTQ
jgi:hypothetical protein